jgi:histidinol dehydrogenase
MKITKYPNKKEWENLTVRPNINEENLNEIVKDIFKEIQENGDETLLKLTEKFDKVILKNLIVSKEELEEACELVSEELKNAIEIAKNNIEKFHLSQIEKVEVIETTKGVKCWRESRGIEKVGIYIPGGTAPLFSTVLMLGIPAKIAACKEIVLCSPPDKNGKINPVILYAAQLVGISSIFKLGGIQAIGAMTFGTATVPKVYKIFGPGNQYVTAAKQLAQNYKVAIDMPAGPSELLIIADESCNPVFVAADLLSQAEHGIDSQVVLLSNSLPILNDVALELKKQVNDLPRKDIALKALENSKSILFENLYDCIEFSNEYAPEHLIIATTKNSELCEKIINAGSVFLGNYSCESAGDYASGVNHTLPTNGFAKNYSGVSLDSFLKKITFQELSFDGIKNIGPVIETMADAEQLFAHKNAVTLRLNN